MGQNGGRRRKRIGEKIDEAYLLDQTPINDTNGPKNDLNSTNLPDLNGCFAFVPKPSVPRKFI